MSIFKIKDNKVIIDPILLVIPEFKNIWERDKSKDKSIAYEELVYIYFMSEQRKDKNPYIDYPAESKSDSIVRGHITMTNWNPDTLVQAAINKNIEFQIRGNSALRFLNSIKRVMEELITKFENINVDERDEKGKPIYKFAEIIGASAKAKDMITTIEALEEKVLREDLTKKTKSKNNTQASDYEV
jgi:hypothetical protein